MKPLLILLGLVALTYAAAFEGKQEEGTRRSSGLVNEALAAEGVGLAAPRATDRVAADDAREKHPLDPALVATACARLDPQTTVCFYEAK